MVITDILWYLILNLYFPTPCKVSRYSSVYLGNAPSDRELVTFLLKKNTPFSDMKVLKSSDLESDPVVKKSSGDPTFLTQHVIKGN